MPNYCHLSEMPDFQMLSERAQDFYLFLHNMSGETAVVKNMRQIRQERGVTDEDIRQLLRRGYLLALPDGQALVVHSNIARQMIQEYVERHGHQPPITWL